jgi:hypothetical protein
LIPRLLRFYGRAPGPAGDWLKVPAKWFWAHVQMMGRLDAEEALGQLSRIAAGNGLMEERDQRQYRRDLARAASGGRQVGVEKANAASLSMLGIKVVDEPMSGGGVVLPPGVDVSNK